tara:strand:+ start:797 stop:1414 length:618 start_codon:yes stop_codon:yes gene_type:complete
MGAKAKLDNNINQLYMKKDTNPCTDFLSNKDYLEHMIPHHQVAIDMCNLMKPISKSKSLHYIYKIIIFNQNIEIFLMKNVVKSIPSVSNEYNILYRDSKFKTSLSFDKKSIPKDYYCDPLFFKPNDHSAHMNHMKHTDKSFLNHMIPHHQVAIVMSERLLKHTNNTHMIRICYEIITSQRAEILKMNQLLDYLTKNKIEFLPNYY